MNRLFQFLRKSFRDPAFCVWSSLLASTAFAFCLTATNGIPVPAVHDEFAYLLGADTYAAGRASNSTHPMWQHFETFHVIHQPTYISKYQPAQSLTLALGQKLGHPFFGVCLATGISIAALVWMLTGWLPRNYFWLVWVFAVLHPGLQLSWGQSYWGGAIPLTGASLLLGSLGRVTARMELRYAILAALGSLLLANSRPFEGAVLTMMVGVGLIWKLLHCSGWKLNLFLLRVIAPGFLVLGAGVIAMMTYNYSVTGTALTMPYQVHEETYGWNPIFLWQSADAKPEYRHPIMDKFFTLDKVQTEARFYSVADVVRIKATTAAKMVRFYCGRAELLALFGLPWLLRKRRYRFALLLGLPVFLAALVTPWGFSHYCAAAAPLIILLMFGCWIEIWKRVKRSAAQPARWVVIALIPFLMFSWLVSAYQHNREKNSVGWPNCRAHIEQRLLSEQGLDLVLVRYSDDHDPNFEWVYNAANIDAADVVWAREISPSRDEELLKYFAGRNVWVVDADDAQPTLRPYFDRAESTTEIGMISK